MLAQNATRTLRYVPVTKLTVLDPMFTTALISLTHGYCVFDTLYGIDANLRPVPQMAAGHSVSPDGLRWEITLRDGLLFHNGEPVRARDCAASLRRWAQQDSFGRTLGAVTENFGFSDDKTIVITLTRPFNRLLEAIGKLHSSPAMMMPEHLAMTDPATQVTEMIGSGPFRFVADEYRPDDRVVYEKFADYQPRSESAAYTSGGKVVHFDRLVWQVVPDPTTAATALQAGEVDWIGAILPDLAPLFETHPDLKLHRTGQFGLVSVLRFNHAQPPFNNAALRRAVMGALDQTPYLQSISASPANYETCLAMFPCGFNDVTEIGAGIMGALDIDAARKAVVDSGYDGEPVVILNPTDVPQIYPHGLFTADLLTRMGMNVELQDTDWGTVIQRRESRAPTQEGGWSIIHSAWPAVSIDNPVTNAMIRGQGDAGWWGWYDDPEMETLVSQWLDAPDATAGTALFDQIHARALQEVPSIPLGRTFQNGAMHKSLNGMVLGSTDLFWNVRQG